MDNFNLIDFISKLSTDKNAQNSISTVLNKLFNGGSNSTNNQQSKKPETYNENSEVYRSPSSYTLYSDMIKRHDEISKSIDQQVKNSPKKIR